MSILATHSSEPLFASGEQLEHVAPIRETFAYEAITVCKCMDSRLSFNRPYRAFCAIRSLSAQPPFLLPQGPWSGKDQKPNA